MSFFTDPTISTLTSGCLSQNTDLGGFSFPRRMGVRFHPDFVKRYHLMGMQARWSAYEDKEFTQKLGKEFCHEDMVSREGWAMYYFDGKFKREVAYILLEIVNPQSGNLIKTMYFEFRKSYKTSFDSKSYVTDPVLGCKIVQNGTLVELKKYRKKDDPDGKVVFRKGSTQFTRDMVLDVFDDNPKKSKVNVDAIIRTQVRYSERAKAMFMVTPPHLMKYAKLILILIKQLVDLNFDRSYMTKSDQKPLYKTRFMLDELGNLQSEGHGISSFQTMLSIGLGQDQQFTLILQTLQQLRDVYGDSVDKIVQGNTSNIIFLKSTDDSMLDTLQKMSGITHKVVKDSKTVTQDIAKIWMRTEGKVSYNMSAKEFPVITYNDMAFIPAQNSIVFRAGDSPIWNRNQTMLPMSWQLFANTIEQPGKKYSLQTIPTLSTAMEFDVRKNQPDFEQMLKKRMAQARASKVAQEKYQDAYQYSDFQIMQLDPDIYSEEVMEIVNDVIRRESGVDDEFDDDSYETVETDLMHQITQNVEMAQVLAENKQKMETMNRKIYAKGLLSRDDLCPNMGVPTHQLDDDIIKAYTEHRAAMEKDTIFFSPRGGSLCSADGSVVYIENNAASNSLAELNRQIEDPESNVYSEGKFSEEDYKALGTFKVKDAFYKFLVSLDSWEDIAGGRFEREMYNILNNK